MRTLVWYRGKDLRISDHEPLLAAIDGGEVITTFVVDPYFFAPKRARELPHRMQFLVESLRALAKNIAHRGGRLILLEGRSVDVIPDCVSRWEVDRVVAHRWVEPFGRDRDQRIANTLGAIPFDLYEGETLSPPGTLRTQGGTPYSVFTPFARALKRQVAIGPPRSAPERIPAPPRGVTGDIEDIPSLETLGLSHNPHLIPGGERAARERLVHFTEKAEQRYKEDRDRMDLALTSRLSADLKFGTVSPRTVWHRGQAIDDANGDRSAFLNQLIWREFCHSTLWDRPDVLERPVKSKFEGFPYANNPKYWTAWTQGKTGYPIVDASARQLLAEGFVHNRARMISASFLTKHLLWDYRHGEAHYLKYLVDGDWAQNNAGWQWAAGCGCDAQPYFRVFNPMTQGKKFDPTGEYVKRWVPELRRLPVKYIHAPWEASRDILANADVVLGDSYPNPIVSHPEARAYFLDLARAFFSSPSAD